MYALYYTTYKPLVGLCNYAIFYAFRLESVYKRFIKNTLNMPAAGGTMGTENKRGGAAMTDRQTQKLLRALLAIVKRCATVKEIVEVLEQMLQD